MCHSSQIFFPLLFNTTVNTLFMYLGIYDLLNSNARVHTFRDIDTEEAISGQWCTLKNQLDPVTHLYWPFVLCLSE